MTTEVKADSLTRGMETKLKGSLETVYQVIQRSTEHMCDAEHTELPKDYILEKSFQATNFH